MQGEWQEVRPKVALGAVGRTLDFVLSGMEATGAAGAEEGHELIHDSERLRLLD